MGEEAPTAMARQRANSRRGGGCKPDAKKVHLVLELSSKGTDAPREAR